MNIDVRFMADFFCAAVVYLILLFTLWKKKGIKAILINTVLYIYIVSVLTVTVMPVIENIKYIGTFPYRYMRLVPFDDYNCGRAEALRQIILNTVMFIPFGILLPMIRKQNLLTVTLLSFQLSVFIEVFQPLISAVRYSDITDVITNTLGGMIGYLLYYLVMKLVSKRNKNN